MFGKVSKTPKKLIPKSLLPATALKLARKQLIQVHPELLDQFIRVKMGRTGKEVPGISGNTLKIWLFEDEQGYPRNTDAKVIKRLG